MDDILPKFSLRTSMCPLPYFIVFHKLCNHNYQFHNLIYSFVTKFVKNVEKSERHLVLFFSVFISKILLKIISQIWYVHRKYESSLLINFSNVVFPMGGKFLHKEEFMYCMERGGIILMKNVSLQSQSFIYNYC